MGAAADVVVDVDDEDGVGEFDFFFVHGVEDFYFGVGISVFVITSGDNDTEHTIALELHFFGDSDDLWFEAETAANGDNFHDVIIIA